jgi:hypothetical protein
MGCSLPFTPTESTPFNPPPIYSEWWAKTEACSGLSKDMDLVKWYVVQGDQFEAPTGTISIGYHDHLHITLASFYVDDEHTVRHEMLHALLFPITGHPHEYFVTRCSLK